VKEEFRFRVEKCPVILFYIYKTSCGYIGFSDVIIGNRNWVSGYSVIRLRLFFSFLVSWFFRLTVIGSY
jgi:hypothetical protein